MLYDVGLRISYAYAALTLPGRQLLRVLPADLPGVQQLHTYDLAIDPPPDERNDFSDFWGNSVIYLAFRAPTEELAYTLTARVARFEPALALDLSIPVSAMPQALAQHRGLDRDSPHHFVTRSPLVDPVAPTTDYALSCLAPGMAAAEAVVAIGGALNADMTFDPEATEVDTPFADAFTQRRGVCQDFTHIMIACLRGIGIPAGYVSGYLRTRPPAGQPRLEGTDAMHAWVRAWCGPDAGWVEYDPTNATMARADHLMIARGRDYGDVAPVKGILKTTGAQDSSQAVDVVPVD